MAVTRTLTVTYTLARKADDTYITTVSRARTQLAKVLPVKCTKHFQRPDGTIGVAECTATNAWASVTYNGTTRQISGKLVFSCILPSDDDKPYVEATFNQCPVLPPGIEGVKVEPVVVWS